MKPPLISIIIPTYNRAHCIGETLNSVLAQTYTNWECIIVDDDSTDTTDTLLATYCKKDFRFKYRHRPKDKHKGASACRNFGYEQSTGEFIQWFDSDDLMHPDKLKIKLEIALKYQSDVIVDTHANTTKFDKVNEFDMDCFTSKDFYINFILGSKPVITNDVMLRRTIIGNIRFDENIHKGEEYEFYSRVFQQELSYCFLEVALSYYRVSPDALSKSPKQVESLIYLSKILKKRHSNNPQIVAKTEKQGQKTYKSLMINRNLKLLIKHFNFFKDSHHKSAILFFGFMVYNYFTKRGFDLLKSNMF